MHTYFNVDVVGEVFEFVRSRQTAKFSVVVVGSKTVVSASLHVDGSQVPTERTSVSEQEVGDLRTRTNVLMVMILYESPKALNNRYYMYFAGEERVDSFLALGRQTSGQMVEVVSLLDDGRSVEVVRQSDCAQQVAVFADQTVK